MSSIQESDSVSTHISHSEGTEEPEPALRQLVRFLRAILPASGNYISARVVPSKTKGKGGGFLHKGFSDVESLAQHLLDEDARGETMYFAMSGFGDRLADKPFMGALRISRKQVNVVAVKSFWLDLDIKNVEGEVHHESKNAAMKAVIKMSKALGLGTPLVVDSGGGLHVYWVLSREIGRQRWDAIAEALARACEAHEVFIDRGCTTDCSRVLRPVGTWWKKETPHREVKWLNEVVASPTPHSVIDPDEFAQALKAFMVERVVPLRGDAGPGNQVGGGLFADAADEFAGGMHDKDVVDKDAHRIANRCAQVGKFRDVRGAVDEPAWYVMLGVLTGCVDGDAIAQEWSSGHAEYDPDATAAKMEQWRVKAGKPPGCEKVKQRCGSAGCEGCPWPARGVTSPMALGYEKAPGEKQEPVDLGLVGGSKEDGPRVSVPATITKAIEGVAWACEMEVTAFCEAIGFSAGDLSKILSAIAFNQNNSKFVLLTPDGEYRVFTEKWFTNGWKTSLGEFYDPYKLKALLRKAKNAVSDDKKQGLIRKGQDTIDASLTHYISIERQFGDMTVNVDMFRKRASIGLSDGTATLNLPHMEYAEGEVDPAVIADYKEHWPQLDEFLDLLVASRFAAARKKAYLWLRTESDWGKGALDEALSRHGLVVSMSVEELKKVLGGGPVGRQMNEFRRAIVLSFNEFDKAAGELKQLEQTIQFSPKNLPICKVQVYLKLFTSAEKVDSLVSSGTGVEDQFANRFSLMEPTGNLHRRPMFNASRFHYIESLTAYVGAELNRRMREYIALGRRGAADKGDDYIHSFHDTHGIGNKFERLSTKMDSLAMDFLAWVMGEYKSVEHKMGKADKTIGAVEKQVHADCLIKEIAVKRKGEGKDATWVYGKNDTPVPEGAKIHRRMTYKGLEEKGMADVIYAVYIKATKSNLDRWLETNFNRAERGKLLVKSSDLKSKLPPEKTTRYGSSGRYTVSPPVTFVGVMTD